MFTQNQKVTVHWESRYDHASGTNCSCSEKGVIIFDNGKCKVKLSRQFNRCTYPRVIRGTYYDTYTVNEKTGSIMRRGLHLGFIQMPARIEIK